MANEISVTKISGLRKSGILLLALDEDCTAEVFKHFSAREIQELSQQMAALENVSHQEMNVVLDDFFSEYEQFSLFALGSNDYLRSVLTKVMGAERAANLLEDIMESK